MKNKITIFVVLIVALFALIFNYVKASGGIEYLNFLSGLTSSVLTKGYLIVGDDAGLSQATSSIFISSIGSVGISTTSPWGLLSVNPSGISSPAFTVGSSTKTDFVITNAGNVGIGTTTPNNLIQIKDLIEFNNTNYSTKLGYQAGYSLLSDSAYPNNTAIGYWSLRSNTTGIGNSALGKESLYSNIDGANNSAFGYDSLHFNTSGSYNMAIGFQSLYSNTSGDYNTAVGEASSRSNTDGSRNSALGNESLYFNTSGSYNIAIGGDSLYSNIGGNRNSALGFQSLFYNQSATNTVAIGYSAAQGTANYNNQGGVYLGYQAGYSAGTGSNYNTLLGYQAGYGITTGTYNIIIGQNVEAPSITGNQQLNIGNLIYGTNIYNGATVSSVPISGNVGIGTTSPGTLFSLGNTGDNTINISATATSTFGSGLNLRTGCFAINGTCVGGGGGGGSGTVNSGVADGVAYYKAADTNVYGTSTLTILPSGLFGVGTTTPGSLLSLNNIANFTTATSSFYGNGINLEDGCFAINGTCVGGGGGGGGSGTVNSGVAGYLSFYPSTGTTVDDTDALYFDNTNDRLGIGTSSPYAKLSVVGEVVGSYFTATSTTVSSTFNNIVPTSDSTYNLGSGSNYWSNIYNDNLYFNSTAYLSGTTAGETTISDGILAMRALNVAGETEPIRFNVSGYSNFNIYQKGSRLIIGTGSGIDNRIWEIYDNGDWPVYKSGFAFYPSTDSTGTVGRSNNYFLGFYTDKLFLNSTATLDGATAGVISMVGNVGVGTTTPAMKFSVQGDALADSWNVYSDIYKGDAITQLKGIKAKTGVSGDWVKVDHNSLPNGIFKNNPVSKYENYWKPIHSDTATTTIIKYQKISDGTILSENEYNTLPDIDKGRTDTWIVPTMSISGLAQMNTRAIQQLDARILTLETVKLDGLLNSQGGYVSEAMKKEIDARINAKKEEIKDYVIQAIQVMSFAEKIKLLF